MNGRGAAIGFTFFDRAERHRFWPRLWLFFSPFLFPPKKRGKKKRRMKNKNRDLKSCLPARSFFFNLPKMRFVDYPIRDCIYVHTKKGLVVGSYPSSISVLYCIIHHYRHCRRRVLCRHFQCNNLSFIRKISVILIFKENISLKPLHSYM